MISREQLDNFTRYMVIIVRGQLHNYIVLQKALDG